VIPVPALNEWDYRLAGGRGNSFDVVRLSLASLVVLEHSFFLIDGRVDRDPLFVISGGQTNCGQIAVYFFFVISGFLVTRSWLTDQSLHRFLTRRVARIVPGFLAATAIGVLVIAPISTNSVRQFFSTQNWIALITQTLALKQVAVIGAFAHNPVQLVHGTLWTIKYEFDCYLAVALLGLVGLLGSWRVATFTGVAIALILAALFRDQLPVIDFGWRALLVSSPDRWPDLFPFFFCGAAFYVFRKNIPKTAGLFWLAIIALLLSVLFGHFYLACLLCGTYAILFFSLSTESNVRVWRRRVDLSYGVYLYGWPIQQLLLFFFFDWLSPVFLFPAAMVLTCSAAWASWRFVEAPCLMLVRSRRAAPAGISVDQTTKRVPKNEAAAAG
jgi:peptidoglycan/LPS O-acetylase OafA/YrhL